MTYKLIKNSLTSVVDQVEYSDSTNRVKIIPFDEANTDYKAYLLWVSEGGVTEAAD